MGEHGYKNIHKQCGRKVLFLLIDKVSVSDVLRSSIEDPKLQSLSVSASFSPEFQLYPYASHFFPRRESNKEKIKQ